MRPAKAAKESSSRKKTIGLILFFVLMAVARGIRAWNDREDRPQPAPRAVQTNDNSIPPDPTKTLLGRMRNAAAGNSSNQTDRVTVIVAHDEGDTKILIEHLREYVGSSSYRFRNAEGILVAPVPSDSVENFAAQIKFGKVLEIDKNKRRVFIDATGGVTFE